MQVDARELAGVLRQSPRQIADALVANLHAGPGDELLMRAETAGAGFVNVWLTPRYVETALDEIRGAGGVAEPVAADVTTETGCQQLVDRATRSFGQVDILVNNAGGGTPFGLTASDLLTAPDPARFRPLLNLEADRAREFYKAGDELIPMIAEDSQPGLWVLVNIYRKLLQEITDRQYDVFSGKVSLTVSEKLRILGRGFLQRLL